MGTRRSLKSKRDELLELLTCSICLEYFSKPVLECMKGHSLCNTCFQKLPYPPKCPTCRSVYSSEPGRNLALEELLGSIYLECSHQGCQSTPSLADKRVHERYCMHNRLIDCPVLLLRQVQHTSCPWQGQVDQFEDHALYHNLQIKTEGTKEVQIDWGRVCFHYENVIQKTRLVKVSQVLVLVTLIRFYEHFEFVVTPIELNKPRKIEVKFGTNTESPLTLSKVTLGLRSDLFSCFMFVLTKTDAIFYNGVQSLQMKLSLQASCN